MTVERDGYRIAYAWRGLEVGPVLVLSHSLGSDSRLWRPQIGALGDRYRILTYDHPGHGASDPLPAPADIAVYARDALAVADAGGVGRFAFCGLSLGGMVGIRLAASAGERIESVVLANTTAHIADTTLLRRRIDLLRREGIDAIVDNVVEKWLTPGFRASNPAAVELCREMLDACGGEAYADAAQTVCELDLRDDLSRIRVPCTVVVGEHDEATPPAWGRAIATAVPGARLVELPAAHLSNVEAPGGFGEAIVAGGGAGRL
ncbi:MAG: alpha/beta fold hydrolase [Spirochaetota bacterium]